MLLWPESNESSENMGKAMAMYDPAKSNQWIVEYMVLEEESLRKEGYLPPRKVEPRRKRSKIEIFFGIIAIVPAILAFGWVILSTLFD